VAIAAPEHGAQRIAVAIEQHERSGIAREIGETIRPDRIRKTRDRNDRDRNKESGARVTDDTSGATLRRRVVVRRVDMSRALVPRVAIVLAFASLAFASSGCASHAPQSSGPSGNTAAPATATPIPTALPDVTAPPATGPKPAWIAELSPQAEVEIGAQIRIRFANDVVPLEALEAPDRQAALAKIDIAPAIPGHFIFVTPKMIVFSAERPLPKAARFVVTLHAGLADRAGNTLDHDLSYTFTTLAPEITLANPNGQLAQGKRPQIQIASNVRLDEASLEQHVHLISAGNVMSYDMTLFRDASPSPGPATPAPTQAPERSSSFDDETGAAYTLVPTRDLPLASTYTIKIDAGIRPLLGNLATRKGASGSVETYHPLAFSNVTLDTSASTRPLESGNPSFAFNNALDTTSALAAISLSPAPKTGYAAFAVNDDSDAVEINPNALEPNTTYTVHIAKSITDVFGQTLGSDGSTTFTTDGLAPDLWVPPGYAIFPATTSVALNVMTANLPRDAYQLRAVPLKPTDVVTSDPDNFDALDALLGKDPAWPLAHAPHTPNVEATTPLSIASLLHAKTGMLVYGVAGDWTLPGIAQAMHTHFAGAVAVTNVGVFAQWFPTGGFVRANHLSDGSPIAKARVEVYESLPATGIPIVPCASGRTDTAGLLAFSAQAFAACLSTAKDDDDPPGLVALVYDGSDWSFARTRTYGQDAGDTYAQWSAGRPHARGTFVSDRNLYQRGETAYFTGYGYFETAGTIARGTSSAYDIVLQSPQGKKIDLGSHALDAYGAVSVHTQIANDAELGDWSITATGERGESFTGTYTVAQFKPPNFKVALALSGPTAVGGDTIQAKTTSTYLFGAPVAGGNEHVKVTRSRSGYTPKGYESFSFGPQYEYPEEPPSLDADVSETDVATASDGTTSVPIPVATDLPYPTDYRVDGETTDVSNLAVSDSQTFTAFPSADLIVLRGPYIATANHAFDFDFAVVDPSGKREDGKAIHFTLARRVFDRAKQLVEGSETTHQDVHYETVAEFDATSSDAVQKLHTTPTSGGEYRLRANIPGAKTEATATDLQLYVIGDGADWYGPDDTTVRIKLDKKTYRPGDRANALIASPYADADLLFQIIRNRAIERTIIAVHGPSVSVPFTITPDMLPNVVVEAVLVRRGPTLAGSAQPKLTDLARSGFATVHVALDSRYVKVVATPLNAQVAPGGTQRVKLHVTDLAGKPIDAELTVAVANETILQLGAYRFPDLVQQIYADLPISTRFADNRDDVKLATQHKYVEKGFGYGGGAMAGPANTRVRTNFRPIAYFNGAVHTDANGDATVSFSVPDDLTTWRVLTLALTKDARFGTTDATFIATKPLVTNPILPQFARPGDVLEGGVSVTNVSATKPGTDAGDVAIAGVLGGALAFTDPANANANTTPDTAKKTHFEGPTAGYRFAMIARAANASTQADATVRFTTNLAGTSDAFSVPLPIVTDDILESVVTTGTTASNVDVPLNIDSAVPNDAGGLHVTLASTLLGDTLAPLDAALHDTYTPFGFESAARIAIASDRILLDKRYGRTDEIPALLKRIAHERENLRPLAKSDGTYAFFPGGAPDVYTTAFVAIQLVQARAAGIDVDADLAKIHAALLAELADPTHTDADCKSDLCQAEARLEALETLAPIGDVRSDHLSEIYALQPKLSYYERVELARHLIRLPQWHDRGIALRDKVLEQLNETGRFAGLVQPGDFGETPIDGESQLLGLMIESKIPTDRVDRAFNSLLAARGRDGTWGCACDDAEAMNAIVLYASLDKTSPDFTGTATLAGGTAFAQRFEGYKVTSVTKDYAMQTLPRGTSKLALARDGKAGTLHYTVDFDYAVRGNVPGAYQGIRIDRIVRPAGATGDPIVTFGLAAPSAPIEVNAGSVFDIEDRITTDHPLESLVVNDSLPAGLEAIDTRFQTNSSRIYESIADWNIDYQTIERNAVVTYAQNLQPGVYAFHYLVRSVTPGTYTWPAARAALALAPDEFGRTAAGTLVIK
jgi:uncharacterized protein YfaS (alpha-2-macroglobulin family)